MHVDVCTSDASVFVLQKLKEHAPVVFYQYVSSLDHLIVTKEQNMEERKKQLGKRRRKI